MLSFYTKNRRLKNTAHEIYGSIVAQTRKPVFYARWGVPDRVEGRFEVLVLHVSLVVRRLNGGDADSVLLGQLVAERFIGDLDDSFREMGVGDLAVPKRMKAAGQAYHGRLLAYNDALSQGDAQGLKEVLVRNIAALEDGKSVEHGLIAAYMVGSDKGLSAQSFDEICRGALAFGPIS